MAKRYKLTWAALVVASLLTGRSLGQDASDVVWIGGTASWLDDFSWETEFVPSADFDEGAFIGNGGSPFIDEAPPDVSKLTISNGTVDIQAGGSLTVLGPGSTGGNGRLLLSGNASLTTQGFDNSGTVSLGGNDVRFESGPLTLRGTLELPISSAGNPQIHASGAVEVGAKIRADFDNTVDLSFGQTWDFVSGASSVDLKANSEIVSDVVLGRGLGLDLISDNNSASIAVSNRGVLTVNRETGATTISNVIGGPIGLKSYTIGSARGLLNPQSWTSLKSQQVTGFVEANPREQQISELNFTSDITLDVNDALDLGNAYNGGATHPRDEDLTFKYSTSDGKILDGIVEYVGPANDLVLRVDPNTGAAAMEHQSSFIGPLDVTAYSILSESGALSVANWNSFFDSGSAGDGWLEGNPQATALAETNLQDSHLFDNGTVIGLGNIFTPGSARDIVFQFATTAGEVRIGTVEYREVEGWDCNGDGVVDIMDANCTSDINAFLADHGFIPGDLDGNGEVAFADFLTLSNNFGQDGLGYTDGNIDGQGGVGFSDFLILSDNFGRTAGATAATVPEPSGLWGLVGGMMLLSTRRRRSRRRAESRPAEENAVKQVLPACLFAVGLLVLLPWSSSHLQAAEYSQTFEFPDGTDDLEDGSIIFGSNVSPDGDPVAQVIGGRLQLTRDDTGSTNANFKIPSLGVDATESWIASFDFEVFDADGPPADGFSFNHGPISEGATGSEEGFGVGLSIEFDTYNNATDEAGHNIAVNNVDVPDGFNEVDVAADGISRHAVIVWYDNNVSLRVDDDIIFHSLPTPGFAPSATDIFAFAARTGGATEDVFIDNLLIQAPVPGDPGDFNFDGAVDLVDGMIMADNFGTGSLFSEGDNNRDGQVDLVDFVQFVDIFEAQGQAGTAAVPEPGGLTLLGLLSGGLLFGAHRRGRRCRRSPQRRPRPQKPVPAAKAFFVALTLLALPWASPQAAEYAQTFEFPDGTVDLGDGSIIFSSNTSPLGDPVAQVIDGRLQLTRDDTGSTSANFKVPSLGSEATESWIASFDFAVFDAEGDNPAADGFSFNYGPIAADATGSEEGFGVGLSVEFDTWNNADGEAGHNIAVNNADVAGGFNEVDVVADGVSRHAEIIWYEGNASLRVDDDIIFRGLPTTGFSPAADAIFAFAARTGGATEDLFIDNLSIVAPVPGNAADFNEDGAIDGADYGVLLANYNTLGDRSKGDANYTFTVDIHDFVIFREAFNAEMGVVAAGVPEPSSLLLGLLGLAVCLGRCRSGRRYLG